MSEILNFYNIEYDNLISLQYLRYSLNQVNRSEIKSLNITYPVSFNIRLKELVDFNNLNLIEEYISSLKIARETLSLLDFSVFFGKTIDSKPKVNIKILEFGTNGLYNAKDEDELMLYINIPPDNSKLSKKRIKVLTEMGFDCQLLFVLMNSIIEPIKYDENNVPFSDRIKYLIENYGNLNAPNSPSTMNIKF